MPKEIRCLVHLRYLSVEGPHYVTDETFKYLVLVSVYKLYHLQVLVLKTGRNELYNSAIETTGMTNLLKLRYMRLPKEIMQTIHGVHKLTSLQELNFFVGQESGQHINELYTLKNLQHLFIENIENIGDHIEAKSANLLEKNNLMSLSLKWTSSRSNPIDPEKIIDYLQPPPSLRELTINNYNGQRSPNWMVDSPPSNLSSLKLLNCHLWKNQLFSGKIPYLKILDISWCQNLDKLPDMPLSLTEFRISFVGLTSLPAFYQNYGNNTPAPLSLKSSLRVVEITYCRNLRSLHGFLQQDNIDLQVIEELTIKNCYGLVHLPTYGLGKLTSLKYLNLTDNPKLVAMDFQGYLLPTKLQQLHMGNCGELDLPVLVASYGITTLTKLKLQNSNIISIATAENIRSLNGFLQQDNIDFQSIKKIEVESCKNLVHLPMGAFGKFVSLEKLTISDCPMLMSNDNQSTLLPMALKYLSIKNCGKVDEPLVESASSLPTLIDLRISNCSNISHIPSSDNAFGSLNVLHISGCKKLVEHSSREQAHGADRGSSLASLKIKDLSIDNLSLLLIEPLRSLSFVSKLTVSSCSWMEALLEQWLLQNNSTLKRLFLEFMGNLNTLPATMVRLTVLEDLTIFRTNLLKELPELPASLRVLYISGADLLKELPKLPASLSWLHISNASSLKSLPATMARLTVLETLEISKADLLEEVPELPASLKIRKIQGRGGRLL